jgi:hypothetical protein
VARTGRFGRSPRSAASLTSTLVAIAREYQNQRAQNIMDAWQKGGTFEGAKATDDVVLKFWKDKAAGVSKDDPLYDTYHNAQTQLDYTIHESKMTAQYALKKVSDGSMVSFYLGWAKKVPKDSEFYRVLQRDAGQYMRTNRANGEAEKRKAEELKYQSQQAGTQKSKEAASEYVIDTIRRIAQSGNVQAGIGPAIAAPGSGSDLTDFDPNDPGVMLRLISAITPQRDTSPRVGKPDAEFVGNTDVLFHDDDGKPVTGTDILKKLGGMDPSFRPGAPFNVNLITDLMDRQITGLNERIARAKATGHMSDVASLTKSKGYVALLNREVAAYPVQKAYQEARADYDSVVSDKTSSPQAVLNAKDAYFATLTKLSQDPRIEADDSTKARLAAEVNGTAGVPTLNESFTGLQNGAFDAASAKDAAENHANIEFMQEQVDAVKSGTALWTYGEKDSNGVFVPKAGGREIGAATPEAVQAGGLNAQVITVADPRGGAPLQIAVTATPIYASAKDPRDPSKSLNVTNGEPIGYAYDMPSGSGTKTQYGFNTKDGFVFSHDPLWGDDAKVTNSAKGGNHIEVDFTDVIARDLGYTGKDPVTGAYTGEAPKITADANLPGGVHVRASTEFDANTGLPKPATIAFDPQDLAWSSGTRGAIGSTDPMTDFKSLTLSNLMSDVEGQSILSNLDKNPQFKTTMDNDAYRYAGVQMDPKTGAPIPGTGDQAKLTDAMGQQFTAAKAKSLTEFVDTAAKSWQRITTGSPAGTNTATLDNVAKLATDLVQGTPFEALGNLFHPGTSTMKQPDRSDITSGFAIKPVSVIKAPALPPVMPVNIAGPIAAPTSSVPVTSQTGSTAPTSSTQTGSSAPGGYPARKVL